MDDEKKVETTETTEADESSEKNAGTMSEADIKKLIQSEADRVRTEYSKKLKAVETEKEELKKSAMSEAEKAKYEREQKEKEILEKEAELNRKERLIEAADFLKESGLDISFRKYVTGNTSEETQENIKIFKSFIDERVSEEIKKRLSETGRTPEKGKPSDGKVLNITEFNKLNPKDRATFITSGGKIGE